MNAELIEELREEAERCLRKGFTFCCPPSDILDVTSTALGLSSANG
jgi:hypothetical protein